MYLSRVRNSIDYHGVREISDGNTIWYEIIPSNENWPFAHLCLECDPPKCVRWVLSAGLGDWHGHFDEHFDPEENLKDALELIRKIVAGEAYVIAGVDASGNYVCGSLVSSSEQGEFDASRLFEDPGVVKLERYWFNRVPEPYPV